MVQQQPIEAWSVEKSLDEGPRAAANAQNGNLERSEVDDASNLKSSATTRTHGTKRNSSFKGAEDEGPKLQAPKFLAELDAMKQELYQNMDKKEYDVKDFYKEEGILQKVARSDIFANVTLVVISLNAMWIGIDTDHNDAKVLSRAELHFQIAEHLFCILFVSELLIRFLSFKEKINSLRDHWFKFDSFLVLSMVIETWIMPIIIGDGESPAVPLSMLRLLRLLRLSRMARLARSFPELVTLMKGIVAALRSVGSTIVLLILFMYVFGIVFAQQSDGHEVLGELFRPLPQAMYTLLVAGTICDDITAVADVLKEESPILCAIFFVFVVIAAFMMLNMLIGILCEVITAVAANEKEKAAVSFLKERLLGVLKEVDVVGVGSITKGEFGDFCRHPDANATFDELGIDREYLVSLTDVIFEIDKEEASSPSHVEDDEKTIVYGELMEILLNLRPSNMAMVKDIVDLQKYLQKVLNDLGRAQNDLQIAVSEVHDGQVKLEAKMALLSTNGICQKCSALRTNSQSEPNGTRETVDLNNVTSKSSEENPNPEIPFQPPLEYKPEPPLDFKKPATPDLASAPCLQGQTPRKTSHLSTPDKPDVAQSSPSQNLKSPDLQCGNFMQGLDNLQDAVYENLDQKEYDVMDFYWTEGIAQRIARDDRFGVGTLVVICVNAMWIGIDTDHNKSETLNQADLQFQVAEHFFCIVFTAELLTRFFAFKEKINCLRDHWFKFDSFLVTSMVLETWIIPAIVGDEGGSPGIPLSMLRLLRLLRLSRMARLARSFPELVTLLQGMVAAVRSVTSTLVLLILFMYVFGIIFAQQSDGIENEDLVALFFPLPQAMFTLFLAGTLCDDITGVADMLKEESLALCFVFFAYVVLASFMVLNMLIGILCEVVTAVAAAEKESLAVKFVKESLLEILRTITSSKHVKRDEFLQFVMAPGSRESLDELGVDRRHLLSLSDVFYPIQEEHLDEEEDKQLECGELLELILRLRPDNEPTVRDLIDLRKFIQGRVLHMAKVQERVDRTLSSVRGGLRRLEMMVAPTITSVQETPILPIPGI